MTMIQDIIYEDIIIERNRQDEKFGKQSHDDFEWLAILSEEIGESAQACLHDKFGGPASGTLRAELIQAASVIVAWIEDLKIKR